MLTLTLTKRLLTIYDLRVLFKGDLIASTPQEQPPISGKCSLLAHLINDKSNINIVVDVTENFAYNYFYKAWSEKYQFSRMDLFEVPKTETAKYRVDVGLEVTLKTKK